MAPTAGRAIERMRSRGSLAAGSYGSFTASPIAAASIARDLEDDLDGEEDDNAIEDEEEDSAMRDEQQHAPYAGYSMAGSYRRPSSYAVGLHSTVMPALLQPDSGYLTKQERELVLKEERSLLRDNNVIPPKASSSGLGALLSPVVSRKKSQPDLEDGRVSEPAEEEPSEISALLGAQEGRSETPDVGVPNIGQKWAEAVAAGKIQTTWQREAKTLAKYSRSLVLTFLLQYSLTVASIFTVGHLGKLELAAVSLASMTSNITGYAIYQGLATSLDTLCAQAFGSGRKTLVGLQLQRMVYFLWAITIPIGVIWLSAGEILAKMVPERDLAILAGKYLKVLLIGAPGYASFEAGKRYVQAQGLFSATLYVLLICAPLNAFLNWLFVWKLGMGFVGAPTAVAITDNLLPFFLFLYVRFVDGAECWGGFTKRAFRNWVPMIKLALPGLLMVEAEFLAFEILTLAASYFGTTYLAAQSVLSTITSITFQIPFPVSIAASTRIANLIGATLSGAAKTSARVALIASTFIGIFNVVLLSSLRSSIPQLFTDDEEVIAIVAGLLPLCAAFQLFDALAACCNGILRGLGRQEVGGWANLFCYYVIAMPISFGTAFGLHWQLYGLWSGVALALGLVACIEGIFISYTSWEYAVEEAQKRNALA